MFQRQEHINIAHLNQQHGKARRVSSSKLTLMNVMAMV
jgi:hypothetical protein